MFYLICLFALSLFNSAQAMMHPGSILLMAQASAQNSEVQAQGQNEGVQHTSDAQRWNSVKLNIEIAQRATTVLLDKEIAQRIIPELPLGVLIQADNVDAIQNQCEGSWWSQFFISSEDTRRCVVLGLLYGASLKAEQSGKVVDYFVDKIRENKESKAAFFAEVDDRVIEDVVKNCHKKLLGVLMEKFPQRVKKVFTSQQAPYECHTRILDAFRQYVSQYKHIDSDVVELFNQYQFDEQLIAALLPMTDLPLINGKINVNKLDEKRALDNASLHKEVQDVLRVIEGVFDTFLNGLAKRLLTSYLRAGLQEQDDSSKTEL